MNAVCWDCVIKNDICYRCLRHELRLETIRRLQAWTSERMHSTVPDKPINNDWTKIFSIVSAKETIALTPIPETDLEALEE